MSIIRDVASLDPRMIPLAEHYLRRLGEVGIPFYVTETRREIATQIAYYLRGRAPVATVKAVYARCGLWAISDAEAGAINTKTLYSKHIDGLAVDIAPAKDGLPWWDAPRDLWLRMFAIAEDECGLDACAAGKWESWQWDWPHMEYRDGALDDFRNREGIA